MTAARHILFVDDELIPGQTQPNGNYMWYYVQALRDAGFHVTEVGGPDDTLVHLIPDAAQYALIVVDVMMPPGNWLKGLDTRGDSLTGLVAVQRFRKLFLDVPIVAFTQYCWPSLADAFRREGCPVLLKDGHTPQEFAKKIVEMVQTRSQPDAQPGNIPTPPGSDDRPTERPPLIDAWDRFIHDLRHPLVAFRAIVERLRDECTRKGYALDDDYFHELDFHLTQMRWLFNQKPLHPQWKNRIDVHAPRAAWLVASIFVPAKRFVAPLLARKRFTPNQVLHDGLEGVRLFVDIDLMTQAVFNLMEDAARRHAGPPSAFRLEIVGRWDPVAGLTVAFRDWGGVPPDDGSRVFDAGLGSALPHGPDRCALWLSREIARAHGGDLKLVRPADPTEFTLTLPAELANRPPRPDLMEADV